MATVVDKRILGKQPEKYWVTYIKQRIKKNKNFLGFVSGPTGSSKSYSSIRIAEELDPEFNIDRIVFGGLELMNLINSDKLKSGSVIVMEEAGVEMSHKNWQSVTNKMLNYLMQTFRHRNFILIMNSPFMDFVDASTRKLFHAEFRTMGIDYKKNEARLKPVFLQYNSRLKKFYYHRLQVIMPEGKIPVDVWRVSKPSEPLRKVYEQKKLDYTNRLNKKIVEELEAVESKGIHNRGKLTENQEEVLNLIKEGNNVEQIAVLQDKNPRGIYKTLEFIKGKGYVFNPVYDTIIPQKVTRYDVIGPDRDGG
jgi:DNA-binding CsgD family transcriptional regulator|tara:strand:+ start:146 stop:1069 length:924 start_codon:yes stop_codon:yes gene_type:complete